MNFINLLYIWHSLLFKKHFSLWWVHDLIMTRFASHFGEYASVESIPETPNLSFTTKWSSLQCLTNARSLHWQWGSGSYSNTPAADVRKEEGVRGRRRVSLLGYSQVTTCCLEESFGRRRKSPGSMTESLSMWGYVRTKRRGSGRMTYFECLALLHFWELYYCRKDGGKECFNWQANTDGLRYSGETSAWAGEGANL